MCGKGGTSLEYFCFFIFRIHPCHLGVLEILSVLVQLITHCISYVIKITEKDDLLYCELLLDIYFHKGKSEYGTGYILGSYVYQR